MPWRRIKRYLEIALGILAAAAVVFLLQCLAAGRLDPKKFSDAATGLAILAGGGWTLYQFALRRAFESALSIDCHILTEPWKGHSGEPSKDEHFVVAIDVVFSNIGNRSIFAPCKLKPKDVRAYEGAAKYPADLQIRRLPEKAEVGFVGWWYKKQKLQFIRSIPRHVPLLYEYTTKNGKVDFFMEPNEKYTLGTIFILPRGHYAAKIVFVGERKGAAEYWSRILYFPVPAPATPAPAAISSQGQQKGRW
jgi:hypothetical protein